MIPYLNEHMEDNCTTELLGYIRNLVLTRIQVNEEQVQYTRLALPTTLFGLLQLYNFMRMKRLPENLGPVVEKPVNASLGLKVNQGFCFSC